MYSRVFSDYNEYIDSGNARYFVATTLARAIYLHVEVK